MQALAKKAKRLTSEARREHLLDVAAELMGERGFESLTIEAIRERAGISRGLAYTHFDDVDDLIFALYEREVAELDRHVEAAIGSAVSFDDKVRAGTRAYFDFVEQRGNLFATLQLKLTDRWFKPSQQQRIAKLFGFWTEALQREYRVTPGISAALARAAITASEMFAAAWRGRLLARAPAEAMAVEFVLGGIRAATRVA
jgi:AcrR family transcriptional regulator